MGSATPPQNNTTLVVLVFYLFLQITSIFLVIRRHSSQALKCRDPVLLVAATVSQTIFTSLRTLASAFNITDCIAQNVIDVFWLAFMPLLAGCLWQLWIASLTESERIAGSPKAIWKAVAITTAILILVRVPARVASSCNDLPGIRIFDMMLCIIWVVILGCIIIRVCHADVGFGVVNECIALLLILVLWIVILISVMLSQTAFERIFSVMPPEYCLLLASFLVSLVTVWYPVVLTYVTETGTMHRPVRSGTTTRMIGRSTHSAQKTSLNEESDLQQILDDAVGMDLFHMYLTRELSVENLMCYMQLLRLEKQPGTDLNADFNMIYENYVKSGSPNEVNISSKLKKRFGDLAATKAESAISIDGVTADAVATEKVALLRRLKRDAFRLMECDSYVRFKTSAVYGEMIRLGYLPGPEFQHNYHQRQSIFVRTNQV